MIIRNYLNKFTIGLAALGFLVVSPRPAFPQAAQQSQAPTYTLPEYNAEQAAAAEKDPATRIKLLDSFVAQFPNSTLMQYIYQFYYQSYYQLKNYGKAIEYADKVVALGDKADLPTRVKALTDRVQLCGVGCDPKAADAHDQFVRERDAAMLGVKLLPDLRKAPNSTVTDAQVNTATAFFEVAAGMASMQLKDYPAAVEAFKAALAINPNDAVSSYRLGLAYLGMAPPQYLDGFWAVARAIDLKIPDSEKVKDYLRKNIVNYEQLTCDSLVDAQLSELLQLAANSPQRPATYTIPSAADIQKVAQASTIISVIADLSGGGDKAKMTWLAICGAEFPEVIGKIIDAQKSDNYVDFMVFTSGNSDEIQAATTANMDVKVWTAPKPGAAPAAGASTATVTPQPDVLRLGKDDQITFAGTIVSYDPTPFLLHWDQVKVDPSVIPEKAGPTKRPPAHKPAPKPSSN